MEVVEGVMVVESWSHLAANDWPLFLQLVSQQPAPNIHYLVPVFWYLLHGNLCHTFQSVTKQHHFISVPRVIRTFLVIKI